MKTFAFDAAGKMTVQIVTTGKDLEGADVEQSTQHDIQPSQLEAHLPMFADDMSPAEMDQALAIIEAQKA